MSGIFLIQPISIPQSAAVDFAGGDVKHVSSIADAISGDTLSGPTRQLAFRDVLLAEKVNELVEVVNNKDQFINLPLPVTTLPGGATQIISNYRIPPGFEARILNAKVSSSPSSAIQLIIGYNANQYGLTSFTTTPVSTFDEGSAGTSFYGTGEFVVQLVNVSGKTATATASIMLTMRPVAAQKGGIIGPGAVGETGAKGDKGDKGDQGNPGLPGVAGPIGMTWRGSWSAVTGYAARDEVQYGGSTWFARSPNTNVPPPADPSGPSAVWDLVAAVGAQGAQGVQGSQGAAGAQGSQGAQGSVGNQGFQGDTGFQGDQGLTGAQGAQGDEGPQGFFGSQGATGAKGDTIGALFDAIDVSTAIVTGAPFSSASTSGVYQNIPSGSNYQQFGWNETTVSNGISPTVRGVGHLRGQRFSVFTGSIAVSLPRTSDGVTLDWFGTDVNVSVTQHGTIPTPGWSVSVAAIDDASFAVISHAADPATKVHITVTGQKLWPL